MEIIQVKKTWVLIYFVLSAALLTFPRQENSPVLRGPYLGQKPPGDTPELFAPGLVSTPEDEYAFEVSRSGKETVFSRKGLIMLAEQNADGTWRGPAVAPFSGKDIDGECCFSPDGAKIFFTSRRPLPGAKTASNVWVSEKKDGVWGQAVPFGKLSHPEAIHALSIAANGNIYDSGLIRFEFKEGRYLPAKALTPPLEGRSPFIAADESYVIFARRPPGRMDPDLHVAFQNSDGTWSAPVPLGDGINTPKMEASSFVTADGKYLFFTRQFDVYWVSAGFIERLRPGRTDISGLPGKRGR